MQEDDKLWPQPDRVGRQVSHVITGGRGSLISYTQELEIVLGDQHISFTTSKIGSLLDIKQSKSVNACCEL